MGVNVFWDNDEKTTIRYDFVGEWTWSDFHIATGEAFALTRSVPHRVDTISNFLPGVSLPADAFFQFRRAMSTAPDNRGITVIVGSSTFIKTLVAVFSSVYRQLGQRLVLADSLDEARAVLAERRAQQPNA